MLPMNMPANINKETDTFLSLGLCGLSSPFLEEWQRRKEGKNKWEEMQILVKIIHYSSKFFCYPEKLYPSFGRK